MQLTQRNNRPAVLSAERFTALLSQSFGLKNIHFIPQVCTVLINSVSQLFEDEMSCRWDSFSFQRTNSDLARLEQQQYKRKCWQTTNGKVNTWKNEARNDMSHVAQCQRCVGEKKHLGCPRTSSSSLILPAITPFSKIVAAIQLA